MANVEPIYVEYEGDDALQYVINKNVHRRHWNESQRAMAAQDAYEMCKASDLPKQTLDEVAAQFNVSKRTVSTAGVVKESASESIQQSVRDGETRVTKNAPGNCGCAGCHRRSRKCLPS